MTTVLEAVNVMTAVAACHQRTAPRMDDEQATIAIATIWSELFSSYDLTVAELIDAVKSRAEMFSDAPEPADIIRIARARRNDQLDRADAPHLGHDRDDPGYDVGYRGESIAAPDPAPYPQDWDSTTRLRAYWYALRMRVVPRTETGWVALLAQLDAELAARNPAPPIEAGDDPDTALVRVNVLTVPCRHCGAPVRQHCTKPGMPGRPREALTTIAGHPTRIEAAALAAGASPEQAAAIVTAATRGQVRTVTTPRSPK